jgi:hypothetical protein
VSEGRSDLWVREELLHLLSISGTLAGLSVTVVAVMYTIGRDVFTATIVDDMFALCALLFLTCTYVIFWTLRIQGSGLASRLIEIVDALFLIGLTLMTAAGFMMVYTVW